MGATVGIATIFMNCIASLNGNDAIEPKKEILPHLDARPLVLKQPIKIVDNGEFMAVVRKVTDTKMTVRLLNHEKTKEFDPVWYVGNEPLHEIRFSQRIANNRIPMYYKTTMPAGVDSSYRRSDLKTGDIIIYVSQLIDGTEECMTLKIVRRPGRNVPIAPGDENAKHSPHHLRMRAEQEYLEKGTPLLEKWNGKAREADLDREHKKIQKILDEVAKIEKEKKK